MKQALHEKIITLLNLNKETPYTILDIGCGSGELLRAISHEVSAESRLIGIDASEKAIEKAKISSSSIEYRQNKLFDTLPFPDETVDVVVSVDTLECIVQKELLLQEIARILSPRGKVLCAHWDWDTQVYVSEQPEILRTFVHAFADWQQGWMDACDGMMGRKLWGLFQRTKHFHGTVDVYTLIETMYQSGYYGYDRLHDLQALVERQEIPRNDYERILFEMEELQKRGEYFYSLNSYIYFGEKLSY